MAREPDKLPVLRSGVTTLEEQLRELDGPLSISAAHVPSCAGDVGDVEMPANPMAGDLGYEQPPVAVLGADTINGMFTLYDGASTLQIDAEHAILDVREWA